MKQFLMFILLFCFQNNVFAQNQQLVDSLESLLNNHAAAKLEQQHTTPSLFDTTEANIYFELAQAYWGNNPEKGLEYAKQCLVLSEQIGYKKGIGNAYHCFGAIAYLKGDYLPALEYHTKALKIRKEIGDKLGISSSYNHFGIIYGRQGKYPEALKSHLDALKIREEIGYKEGIATSYNNIGNVHENMGDYPEALKYHLVSLKLREEIGNKKEISMSYLNIGLLHYHMGHEHDALKFYQAALSIKEEIGDKHGIATTHNNLGNLYMDQGKYDESLKSHLAALKIREELGDKKGIGLSHYNCGLIYTRQKRFSEAAQSLSKSLAIAKEINFLVNIRDSYNALSILDSNQGKFKQSLENYKMYIDYRDSLKNEENTKKMVQFEMQYDFDKKQDSIATVQRLADARYTVDLQRARTTRSAYLAGFGLMAIIAFLLWNRYRIKQRANKQLTQTLTELKSTQQQLVESEKMAAFGVIASRVAHEIQNPLNFVNNFSELSEDLVQDIVSSNNEQERIETAKPLLENLQKINHHGKRAATIVKELQEHTLKGTTQEFFETKQK